MTKLFGFIIAAVLLFGGVTHASFTDAERQLAAKLAVRDLEIEKSIAKRERELRAGQSQDVINQVLLRAGVNHRDHCDDDDNGSGNGSGSGSQSCWDKCSAEGWSSSTCAERCGTSTGSGSQSCWDKCSAEGWSSSTCADRCGTSTGSGSQSCWDKCSAEGWSSSTCADRCGTN